MNLHAPVRVGGDVVEQISIEIVRSRFSAKDTHYFGADIFFQIGAAAMQFLLILRRRNFFSDFGYLAAILGVHQFHVIF